MSQIVCWRKPTGIGVNSITVKDERDMHSKGKRLRLAEQMAPFKQFFAELGKSGITVEVEETL